MRSIFEYENPLHVHELMSALGPMNSRHHSIIFRALCIDFIQSLQVMWIPHFFLQKKAKLALLDQERTKARMEKLQEEDRKIRETLEESDKLCSEVMRTHCNLT